MASKVFSWNMEGGTEASYKKVNEIIASDDFELIALQEAGSSSYDTNGVGAETREPLDVSLVHCPIDTTKTYIHSLVASKDTINGKCVYRYFLNVDDENLAFISAKKANTVYVLTTDGNEKRPILGLEIENEYFFNVHANDGSDAILMITKVMTYMKDLYWWLIVGDFKLTPKHVKKVYPYTSAHLTYLCRDETTTTNYGIIDKYNVAWKYQRCDDSFLHQFTNVLKMY